ncbi:MAG: helix-turn-helix domain-containing protein [Bryobacteraceae bacterium]
MQETANESTEQRVGPLLRGLRESRGLSVRTLAARAGFSPSFISQVENGLASPSIASLERIARCLNVSLVQFFQATEASSDLILRLEQRPRLESQWSNAKIESLWSSANSSLEPVMVTIAPGGSSGKRPHSQPLNLFAIVFDGAITLVLGDRPAVLHRGDAVAIPAHRQHRWVNEGKQPAQVLMITLRSL